MGNSRKILRYLLFIIPFIFSLQYSLANERLIFEHLNTNDGLSNGTVNKIYRDSKGFLWICTEDGLNKYDGYTIKVYQPTFENKKRNTQFKDVAEDRFGHLWFATTFGLYYYDRDMDDIILFKSIAKKEVQQLMIPGMVLCVLIDKKDNLWLGSYSGLNKIHIRDSTPFNIDAKDVQYYHHNNADSTTISNSNVISIAEDKQGKVWFTSYSNFIDSYDADHNSFNHKYYNIPDFEKTIRLNRRIKIDENNNIWVYSDGQGIATWNHQNNRFEKIILKDNTGKPVNTSVVTSLIFDKMGRTWIGTDGNGIVIWDQKNQTIDHYKNDENDLSNLSSNGIYSIYEDFSGIVWIGTYVTGLNKTSINKSHFGLISSSISSNYGLNNNIVNAFCEDYKGNIWIATDGGGLNILDPSTLTFSHLKHDQKNPNSISTNITNAVFEDKDRNIWVGTYNGGLNRYDPLKKTFEHYWPDPKDSTTISSKHPWRFAQDKNKNLWIGTINNGMNLLKPGANSFIQYRRRIDTINTPDIICSNALNYLFVDSKNNLWICTEYGLDKVNLNIVDFNLPKPKLFFKHYKHLADNNSIGTNRVTYITEDKKGNMWIATNGAGLSKLDIKTDQFTHFTTTNGLSHNIVKGILFDMNENIWISTNNGLSKLDIQKLQFKNYGSSDGLQSSLFTKTSCFKTKEGMMFFGGVNGFNAFYPDKIVPNQFVPNVVITDFKLFSNLVAIGDTINKRIILPKAISELKELNLSYSENIISFNFTALDFYSPENNLFSYKMEGFDNDWRFTDAKNRTATYTNLDPGTYTFRVKASNNEGVWNETGTSIKIMIHPPWWETWWFILIFSLAFASLLIFFYFYRVSALHKQKKILEKMVSERTAQLQIANNELQELNATKDKFVSIIAHDIISPFNTILGFSELLIQNFNQWHDDEKLETINLIFGSSKRLFDLLENLLQWSRSERGLINIQPENFELKETIKNTISILDFAAKAKNIKIIEPTTNGEIYVFSDTNIIHTIVRNLLSNAIKFTSKGGTIQIELKVVDKYAVVSIIDNGLGIPKENIENLFRIDVNHSTIGTNEEKGTGLGLVLVKDFVAKQGGELSINSKVGKGSTFSFTIPLADSEQS